ncbi:hypothetical protein FQY83_00650 [Luteimonas marina]|uniref:Uncharacterized protein n=1 Tax=Luteimonas marina TaxID=488485 RepID=A0A5C5UC82_9GAMM|nr:hypothetical protein FQY83_00650 [Luteimonas marina]
MRADRWPPPQPAPACGGGGTSARMRTLRSIPSTPVLKFRFRARTPPCPSSSPRTASSASTPTASRCARSTVSTRARTSW